MTRLFGEERGAAALEFALLLPFLAAILFLCIEVGNMVRVYFALTEASRSATRYALGSGNTGRAELEDLIENLMTAVNPGEVKATVVLDKRDSNNDNKPTRITVKVACDYVAWLSVKGLFSGGPPNPIFTMSASTSMPLP